MRVLFISQLFDPENSIKGLEFARRLQSLGHEIEVVTTYPSYPYGKLFDGYRQNPIKIENIDGVRVVRLPTFISHGKSIFKRMMSYGSFGIVSLIYSLLARKKYDVVYAYYPPVIVGLVAITLRMVKRMPYIYDIQDMWPEALIATGKIKRGKISEIIEKICKIIYKKSEKIVVQSQGYRRELIRKGVPERKISIIYNWCDEARMGSNMTHKIDVRQDNCFNIIYAGNIGSAQALEHVVKAALLLSRDGVDHVQLTFIGEGVEKHKIEEQVRKYDLRNVHLYPQVPLDEIANVLASADALLIHLANDPLFDITIPSKLQAYMMAGRPILAAVNGEAASIVNIANAGIVVEPCNSEKLARAIKFISCLDLVRLRQYGINASNFYQKNMSMNGGIRMIDSIFRELSSGKQDKY